MKKIIQETIAKVLKEYKQPSFDANEFKKIAARESLSNLIDYCTEHLGESVGSGSSRSVFDFEDDTVLKVAYNEKGTRQNNEELKSYEMLKNPLIPYIYDYDKDSHYPIWLLSEAVIPATEEDFEKILGIPYGDDEELWRPTPNQENIWDYSEYNPIETTWEQDQEIITFLGFLAWYRDYENSFLYDYSEYENESYMKLMNRPWFQYLIELFEVQDLDEFFLPNFGIAMREGKPALVVLDIGYNENV